VSLRSNLPARLAALALAMGVVQITFVSQLPVAGGAADLAPLTVMSVGLLCGPLTGGVFGFALGLFLDVALLQTLGVSSLILLGVGYWSGRIAAVLSDPEGTFVPLVVGAAATVTMSVTYSIVQFLLDVSAPVSGVLLRQLLATLILNTLLALPVHALVRRWLQRALPAPPRRRRGTSAAALSPLQQGLRTPSGRRTSMS
jgi:rod shape-determining protein MreD